MAEGAKLRDLYHAVTLDASLQRDRVTPQLFLRTVREVMPEFCKETRCMMRWFHRRTEPDVPFLVLSRLIYPVAIRIGVVYETQADGISGVTVDEIVEDMAEFQRMFNPGHPQADENGYVMMPNVNLPVEMINLSIASRAYQANAAILKRYQQMVETTLELLR